MTSPSQEAFEEFQRQMIDFRTDVVGENRPEGAPTMTALRWSMVMVLSTMYGHEVPAGLPPELVGLQCAALGIAFALDHPDEARSLLGYAMGQQDDAGRGQLLLASETLLLGASTDQVFNLRLFAAWQEVMAHEKEWRGALGATDQT